MSANLDRAIDENQIVTSHTKPPGSGMFNVEVCCVNARVKGLLGVSYEKGCGFLSM
ncbi:hypothetical protein [Ruegeria faecimaris]|uniref:hypothetical protein n=1 Tax=Ruegeria faecimaris TaxID=686389 RepID=UPI002FE460FD